MEKVIQFLDKKFLTHWFVHAILLSLFSTINSTGTYVYHRFFLHDGYFQGLMNPDGTPFSGFQYFLWHHQDWLYPMLAPFVFTFFIELNYKWVRNNMARGIFYIIKTSLFCGLGVLFCYFSHNVWLINVGYQVGGVFTEGVQILFIFIIYSVCYTLIRHSFDSKTQLAQQSQAELTALKTQLNPHFFFNSLNSLYGTALQENASKTVSLIEQLSSIMRYTLGEAQNHLTDVRNEMEFVENYWALQQIRLPQKSNIQLSKRLFFDEKPTQIAPFLLIPFIENAFKYGSSVDKKCTIDLVLTVENQQLKMVLSNTIQQDKILEKGNGIGIENTKRRLDLMYGSRYSLMHNQNSGIYTVVLNIQLT
jgi:hypothetical protein